MFTTLAAVGLIIYGSVSDGTVCQPAANYPTLNINKLAVQRKELMCNLEQPWDLEL